MEKEAEAPRVGHADVRKAATAVRRVKPTHGGEADPRAAGKPHGRGAGRHDVLLMVDASTIIVTWNSKQFLAKCLDSMRAHHRNGLMEVIVVDNASSDGTVSELKPSYPDVLWIENRENTGFAKANNLGMERASGRYLCLVNPDVEFLDNSVERLCRYMDAHPEAGLCGPRILNSDRTLQYSCREYPSLWNNLCFALGLHRLFPRHPVFSSELMSYFDHDEVREVEAISGCFVVVRREALLDVGPLDEGFFMYSEDLDWCRRFNDRGWKIVFNPEATAVHYGGGSSDQAPADFAVMKDLAITRYWRKHHGAVENMLIRGILLANHALRYAIFGVLCLLGPERGRDLRGTMRRHAACFRTLVRVK